MVIGLLAIYRVASVVEATVRGAGEAIGVIAARTPTTRPTQRPLPTRRATPEPTRTPQPPRTPKPAEQARPPATSRVARAREPQQAVMAQPSPVPSVRPTDVPLPPPVQVLAASEEAPARTDPAGRPPQGSDCPLGYPVKGNQSRIYHTPSSRYYSRTKPEWCFATVEDAEAAGFRPPDR